MSLASVQNINFEYPRKRVLKNISFEIEEGSITALVGPNGAGKTTLLRCMVGLETPISGRVIVNGIDVHDRPRDAHRHIGYLSDFFGLYDSLTVRQCLTYMAWCHKLPLQNLKQKIEALAEEVELTGYMDQKAGALSRGYRQRLGVGLALIHDPKCIFLDEPASGMDPEARVHFSALMVRLKNRGMTIIVSSHILAELEEYCTDMLVIRDGEIKSHIILEEHRAAQEAVLRIGLQTTDQKYIKIIESYTGVSGVRIAGHSVALAFNGGPDRQVTFLKYLVGKDVPVSEFTVMQKSLQAAYMELAISGDDSGLQKMEKAAQAAESKAKP
ncbi:MAG: ABC transporter ATP-binding protein [Alphaproteobacteria bacterium]|nr:ABC transporter ATP-binding protein [Alphaproteobacteria bacterium]